MMMIQAVFVYGTLKRGQCRARLWPVVPQSVGIAWTRGTLFSRSDYPAMRAGDDRILGELWKFRQEDMESVLRTLDEIEGTNQPGAEDWYVRVVTPTWSLDNQSLGDAYAYHYARDPVAEGFVKVRPNRQEDLVRWPSPDISPSDEVPP